MRPSSPWLGASCSRCGGLHAPGLDAELAQPQPLVGLEHDARARAERDLLAAGVLEQVARELGGQFVLGALELLRGRSGESQTAYSFGA